MKRIRLILICFLFIPACTNGILKNKSYNAQKEDFNIERDFLVSLIDFNYEIRVDSTNSMKKITNFNFTAKKPYRTDGQGNWFYRWTLSIEKFNSADDAVTRFNKMEKDFSETVRNGSMSLKGYNSRTLISENYIYKIIAGCKEGRHVQTWFDQLILALLKEKQPELNTVLETDCGGGFKTR
jgi:hypothetical protein